MKFDEETMKKLEQQVSEILCKRRQEVYREYQGSDATYPTKEAKLALLDVLSMDLVDVFQRVGFRTRSFMLASGFKW